MAKRFTDTNKWKDSWFQDLPIKYKLFWFYLLDECDNSGVWKPNIRLATFQIGEPFEEIELRRIFGDRIEVTEGGYWFIKKFIDYQYGELSEACKPHQQVIQLLKKHKIKGYSKGIHTLKDKDKEEDIDKDKVETVQSVFDLESNPNGLSIVIKESGLIAVRIHQQSFEKYLTGTFAQYYQQQKMSISKPPPIAEFFKIKNGDIFNSPSHVWTSFKKLWINPASFNKEVNRGKLQ